MSKDRAPQHGFCSPEQRTGPAQDSTITAHFEQVRQALAMVDHSSIAERVHQRGRKD